MASYVGEAGAESLRNSRASADIVVVRCWSKEKRLRSQREVEMEKLTRQLRSMSGGALECTCDV